MLSSKTVILVFVNFFLVQCYIYEHHIAQRFQKGDQCFGRYLAVINQFCTYPKTNWPCLNGTKIVDGVVRHPIELKDLATRCCFMRCSVEYIVTNYCCSSPDCIKSCYNVEVENDIRKDYFYFG